MDQQEPVKPAFLGCVDYVDSDGFKRVGRRPGPATLSAFMVPAKPTKKSGCRFRALCVEDFDDAIAGESGEASSHPADEGGRPETRAVAPRPAAEEFPVLHSRLTTDNTTDNTTTTTIRTVRDGLEFSGFLDKSVSDLGESEGSI